MPLYLCRWPNGDASVVHAADPDEAAILLDEVGNADEAEYRELDNFLVHFRLEDDGSLQVDEWSEPTHTEIFEVAYPGLAKALAREVARGWEPGGLPIPKRIRAAVEQERERPLVSPEDKPQARMELGRELQQSMGAPAALIDALLEHAGGQILKRTKGPKH